MHIGKSIILLVITLAVFIFIWQNNPEISKRQAEQLVIQNLEEKYGGNFEVRNIEKVNAGAGVTMFVDHIYVLCVYSDTLHVEITVEINRDGTDMSDDYEYYLYRDRVETEIHAISKEQDGWEVNSVEPCYWYYNVQKSENFDAFKKDEDKLELDAKISISDPANANLYASLCNYINAFLEQGYNMCIKISYKDRTEILNGLGYGDVVMEEDMEQVIHALTVDMSSDC